MIIQNDSEALYSLKINKSELFIQRFRRKFWKFWKSKKSNSKDESLKWQCRLIFESKSWKKFKVNNHHSGVTYGCTGKHWTVENFFFQSLPRHLADTVEDVKNQPHSRWKIVFFIFQRKLPKFKKWVWPVKIPWKLSILCL